MLFYAIGQTGGAYSPVQAFCSVFAAINSSIENVQHHHIQMIVMHGKLSRDVREAAQQQVCAWRQTVEDWMSARHSDRVRDFDLLAQA